MSSTRASDPANPHPHVVSLLEPLIRADTHNPGGNESTLARLLATELSRHGPDELKMVEVPRLAERVLGIGISSGNSMKATAGPLTSIAASTLGCNSPKMPSTFLGPRQILP